MLTTKNILAVFLIAITLVIGITVISSIASNSAFVPPAPSVTYVDSITSSDVGSNGAESSTIFDNGVNKKWATQTIESGSALAGKTINQVTVLLTDDSEINIEDAGDFIVRVRDGTTGALKGTIGSIRSEDCGRSEFFANPCEKTITGTSVSLAVGDMLSFESTGPYSYWVYVGYDPDNTLGNSIFQEWENDAFDFEDPTGDLYLKIGSPFVPTTTAATVQSNATNSIFLSFQIAAVVVVIVVVGFAFGIKLGYI